MAGIEVPVSAPGLASTADGFNRLGASATTASGAMVKVSGSTDKMARSYDALRQKLGSGEVIRNASASFALMATSSAGTTEKIAGLAGALASVPGPIGLVAAGVAAAATIFSVYSKSAEEAARKTEELKKELLSLGTARASAQKSLADAVGGAAVKLGPGLRRALGRGASQTDLNTGSELAPGDASGALGIAGALGGSKLDAAGKAKVIDRLKALRAMGEDVSAATVVQAIKNREDEVAGSQTTPWDTTRAKVAQENAAARGGGIFGTGPRLRRETGSEFTTGVLDLAGRDSANNRDLLDRFNASRSQGGMVNTEALTSAEAPAVADTNRQFRDAFRGAGTIESEALRAATANNTTSTDNLTKAIVDLDAKIKAATEAQRSTGSNDASIDAVFKYGRDSQDARR